MTTDFITLVPAIIASCLVVISFFMKTMIPLRLLAIGSNIGFITYGLLAKSFVVLALHAALFPLNIYRTAQMIRLTRRVEAAAATGDPSGDWLKPYMRTRHLKAGEVLFQKGDRATELYYLADGRIEFVEIGEGLEPGRIFGEIAFFTPGHVRTVTARCTEDSTVMRIDESTLKQLYFQNPKFGFHLVGLVAQRLAADVSRLEAQLSQRPSADEIKA